MDEQTLSIIVIAALIMAPISGIVMFVGGFAHIPWLMGLGALGLLSTAFIGPMILAFLLVEIVRDE